MSATFNSVDYFIILIFAVSMLLGFMRGLLKEILSLVTWVAAAAISSLFSSKLASVFGSSATASSNAIQQASQGHYGNFVALGVSFVVLFLGTLFAGYIVNTIVMGIVQGAYISLPNRLMGAAFGTLRAVVISIVVMFIAELTPIGDQAAWGQSYFVKTFEPAVTWLQKLVQPGLDMIRSKASSAMETIKSNAPSMDSGGMQSIINNATGGSGSGGGSTDPYSTSNAGN